MQWAAEDVQRDASQQETGRGSRILASSLEDKPVGLASPIQGPRLNKDLECEDEIAVLRDHDAERVLSYDADDSPFPEVRAVVRPEDDASVPVNTIRMWVIGLFFTIVGSGLNQFFSLRQPSVSINSLVAQLLAFPVGCAWARWMPVGILNPDRHFNVKEHALITIMANVSFGSAAATQVIEAAVKFYDMPSDGGFEILLCVTTQLFGFGLAGLAARWLVTPASMIWPRVLSNAALLTTLHSQENVLADGWRITRLRFFLVVFVGGALWYFAPGYLFTGLSTFSFICWIVPSSVVVNQLFGQVTGLGMSVLTFDWAQIVYANQSPLLVPFWAGLNVMGSFALFYWLICPILYYTNTWYSAHLPILNSNTFDNTGHAYNTSRIMDADGSVNQKAYEAYSPLFLPVGYAMTFGVAFANLTGIFVHIGLYHGRDLWQQWKGTNKRDVHARIMSSYHGVPWWWFGAVTLVMFVLSVVTNEVWRTELPIWAVFVGFVLPTIYFIPVGVIKALTNISSNQLNLLSEFIGGYAIRGKPMANMIFKFYGYVAIQQGLEFVADMKLSHYMHISPRTVFAAQGIAALLGAIVQCGVTVFMITTFDEVCTPDADGNFTCPHGRVTYSSSLIWGAIGPGRLFSPGQIYGKLLWFFLVGPALVIATYLLGRRWTRVNYVSWPVALGAMSLVPPATGVNFSSWWATNVIFNGLIRHHYVLSAALDCGVAVSTVVIFFCITLPAGPLKWWGNVVYTLTADGQGTPYKNLPGRGYFGPERGTWS
ncbi:Glutathione transporter 1 [Penicillium oxalicum]|uniref:Glutathione transporter 1 n=1 Tax=Penicillium oxalicum TaxID=69781 RepID=UPI0020B754DD|nr:Glutathione transporter 1 [Penicillium oxalicum]KAI2789294.1 Glutathione transporter 1 [Penicillium oxalicum]